MKKFDLTNPQKSIWVTEEFYKGTSIENIAGTTVIKDKVDYAKLKKAINIFVKNNDSLRLRFVNENNSIKQYVADFSELSFNVAEISVEKDLKDIEKDFANSPFDIFNSYLFRFQLFKYSDGHGGFVIVVHHLIADAWGSGLIISEVLNTYNSLLQNEEYINQTHSYLEYIEAEQEYLSGKKFEKDKAFWNEEYNVVPENATIPGSIDSKEISSKAKRKQFKISAETMELINKYCKKNKISPYNFFMGAYSLYLSRVSSLDEFVIGTPLLNRSNAKEKHTIGMFISVVPFKVNIDHSKSFSEFVSQISSNFFNIFRHQKYPYQMLLEDLRKQDKSVPNLYNVMLSYQNMRTDTKNSVTNYETTWLFNGNSSDDLEIHFFDINDSGIINVAYDYKTSKYTADDMYSLHSRLLHIMNQILENNDVLLKDIEIVTPDEKEEILYKFNETEYDYPKDKTISELFEEQVEKTPNNIALVFEDQKLTYKELNEKANSLAYYLKKLCPGTKNVISIHLEKNINYIVSILATLKTGNIFLPISTLHPKDRIEYIIKNSETKVLISNNTLSNNINFSCPYINIDDLSLKNTGKVLKSMGEANDIAYILYTSGSTGNPKGVKIKNYSLVNHVFAINKKFNNTISKNDNCLSVANISFDASIQEIFIPLLLGSTLHILPDSSIYDIKFLSNYIEKQGITFSFIPPNILDDVYEFLKEKSNIKLNKLLVGVEKISFNTLNKYLSLDHNMQIHNGYGPTEATICCISYMYNNSNKTTKNEFVPIGSPMGNNKILIVESSTKKIQPVGVLGEIVILGDQVSAGYTNSKLNTPFYMCDYYGKKAYCTGDFGYYKSNGDIVFVGRKDNQVKINGHRIELLEIDNVIQGFKNISRSITLIKNNQIISFFVSPKEEIVINDLKGYLKNKLPNYMIPYRLIQIEKLPITKNGKIDKNVLLSINTTDSSEILAPANETEKQLYDIFASLLQIDSFNTNDSFFDLGGDSLTAIRLSIEISKVFSKDISVQDIFNNPSIQDISKYLRETDQLSSINIESVEKNKYYPISSAQKRIYFASSMAGEQSVLYNTSGGIILDGEIDYKKLEKCFKALVNRHESLRTYFELKDTNVVQKIAENISFKLDYIENKNYSELDDLFKDFVKPFDLSKAPLFRAQLVDFGKSKSALFVDMHHIISDGTSLSIIVNELCKLYNDEVLPKLNITYKDFSAYENDKLSSGQMKEAEVYWVQKFNDEVPVLNLPTKVARPATQSFEGKRIYTNIDIESAKKIEALASKMSVTPYMIMLGAYYILLFKYTSQNDIVIGTPVVGRDVAEAYNIIGMFVNSLAIRENVDDQLTIKKFINQLKEDLLDSYKYQSYPFDELVSKLDIPRDPSRNPLFDTMFTYQNNGYTSFNFNGIKSNYYIPDMGISKFDLSIEAIPNDNGLNLSFEYATKLFDEDFIKNMAAHYLNIIEAIIENTDIKISEINMMSAEEENKVLYEFNNTKLKYPKTKTAIEVFENQVKDTPDIPAVIFGNKKLTYKELNEKANSLANNILDNDIKENSVIGIMTDRSFGMIISVIAVLKSGAAYVLLDKTLPESRINYILKNCNASLLITDFDYNTDITDTININNIDLKPVSQNPEITTKPTDPFALLYTSGSTGNPKGVVLENRGLINLILNYYHKVMFENKSKKVLGHSSVSFDMFFVEIFTSLLLGGTLYLLTEEEIKSPSAIAKIIIDNKINFSVTTPTKVELLLSTPETAKCLSVLDTLQLGGEVFTSSLYEKLRAITNANIFNGYGPTEITACCSGKKIVDANSISIGTPLPNVKIYILDKNLKPCPINIPGEICIAGVGLAKEYIGDEKRTSQSFVTFPETNERIYKTGDIGILKNNGEISFIGRNDFQVKINGLRIELSEIEKSIMQIAEIKNCVVLADSNKNHLKAFLVSDDTLNIPSIRKALTEKLPLYMVPKFIFQIDSIPVTANGKINRKVLESYSTNLVDQNVAYVAPETDLQKTFCSIWENILQTEVGIDNDLFELGADSLSAIKFKVEALNQGIDVPYADIFKLKTIRNLSESKTEEVSTAPIEEFNYDNINQLLKKNRLQLNYRFTLNKNNNVLLLGSNGFVGMHIIDSFIKNDTGTIYCLMRDKNGKGALNRFLEILHFYFGDTLDSYIGNRIIVLKGDILKENFGLSQRNYNKVIEEVSVIINTAANVKHFGDFNKFKNINIDAINRTIDFCKAYSKRLIHLSTLSISGNMFIDNTISKEKLTQEKKVYFSERNLFVNQSLDNVYTRSKFEAERIVLDNIASGNINGIVLRLGNITSRYSDGKFQINPGENAFTLRLKAFVNLGVIPKYLVNKEIEFTPVDLCADSIIKCMQYNNKTTSVLHIYNRNHVKISKIIDVLKDFNLPIRVFNDDDFIKYIDSVLSNKEQRKYINGIANDFTPDRKLIYDSNIYIKSDFSIDYLLRCRFKWSKIDREYIIKYITYLKSINFFTKD